VPAAKLRRAFPAPVTKELAYQLEHRGYTNYFILTHDDESCAELADDKISPTCIHNSVTHKTHGYDDNNKHFKLWVARYHSCALFSAAGFGCTLLDADTVIQQDFMPLLKEFEKEYSLINLGEGIANGGMWHLRASNASSAGLWVIKQIERRSALMRKWRDADPGKRDPGLKPDQDELGEALRVAAAPDGSAFDFYGDWVDSQHKDHPFWAEYPQSAPTTMFTWKGTKEHYSSPWLHPTCPWAGEPERCARLATFERKNALRDVPLFYQDICVPWDAEEYDESAPCEKVLNAPLWLFHHGDPLRKGFEDQVAAYHLLGIELTWMNHGPGSHASRYIQWLARPGMSTVTLDASKSYVALADALVEKAAGHEDVVHIKMLLKHFFNQAITDGKVPVMPRFSCSSPWIAKGDDSYLGINDLRVVDDGKDCYPSAAGFDSCWPNVHYVYPFTLKRLNIPWTLYETVSHAPPAELTPLHKELHESCKAYFEELT
jgi:Nucleotide-diphospho-sugar transferase